jgi:hypothetical protein
MAKHGARDWYEDGVADHYREHGSSYRNPHAPIIDRCLEIAASRWMLDLDHVLDLAAGAGEFTLALSRASRLPLAPSLSPSREGRGVDPSPAKGQCNSLRISACDAFTMRAFEAQTGLPCRQLTFEQIAAGALRGQSFSLIGCSFAMHLCPTTLLPVLLLELSQIARQLMILSPHKRPIIRDGWGWRFVDSFTEERVHMRLLETTMELTTLSYET